MITQGKDLRTKLCRVLSEEVLLWGNEKYSKNQACLYTQKETPTNT